jgi:subtilisin family serine protease
MKGLRWITVLALLGFLMAYLPSAEPVQAQTLPDFGENYIPGELVVTFNDGLTSTRYQALAASAAHEVGATLIHRYDQLALLSAAPDADLEALAGQLMGLADVRLVEPNYIVSLPENISGMMSGEGHTADMTLDVDEKGEETHISWDAALALRSKRYSKGVWVTGNTFPREIEGIWAYDRIRATIIWDNTNVSPTVCLVDSGVDYTHPDLYGRVTNGYDFINYDSLPNDDNGHGTHIAGIISAKANYLADSAAGVSNGKVLAVKVVNANGMGGIYHLAAGLRYCAKQASVKVINLSLEVGWPSQTIYDALDANINHLPVVTGNKPKLIVTSAGNMTNSYWNFPAAWAKEEISRDPYKGGPDNANEISHNLISVAASDAPWMKTWVDKDGNGVWWQDDNVNFVFDKGEVRADNEFFDSQSCLTPYSSYGSWVEMVAPGAGIYSTTPTHYPFREMGWAGMDGYDWMEGTSQATAFVSGSAARVWSVYTTETAPMIHDRLIERSMPWRLTNAVDPNTSDPSRGYDADVINPAAEAAGTDINFRNEFDAAGVWAHRAPFCLPYNDGGAWGNDQNMDGVAFLNVARAMNRVAFKETIRDAGTGLPLIGAQFKVYDPAHLTTSSIGIVGPATDNIALVTNVKLYDTPTQYRWQYYKSGYTAAYVSYNVGDMDSNSAGYYWIDQVSIPKLSNNLSVVLEYGGSANLDLLVYMPEMTIAGPPWYDGVIDNGSTFFMHHQPALPGWLNLFGGTMSPPTETGSDVAPYATNIMSSWGNDDDLETTIIRGVPIGTVSRPWYKGSYQVFVTDYSRDYEGGWYPGWDSQQRAGGIHTSGQNDDFAFPHLSVWTRGKLVFENWLNKDPDSTPTDCTAPGYDLWHPLDINWNGTSVSFTEPVNRCTSWDVNLRGGVVAAPYPDDPDPVLLRPSPYAWKGDPLDPFGYLYLITSEPVTEDPTPSFSCTGPTTDYHISGNHLSNFGLVYYGHDALPLGETCDLTVDGSQFESETTSGQTLQWGDILHYGPVEDLPPTVVTTFPMDNGLMRSTDSVVVAFSELVDIPDLGWVLQCKYPQDFEWEWSVFATATTQLILNITPTGLAHTFESGMQCELTIKGGDSVEYIYESDNTIDPQFKLPEDVVIHFSIQ